MTKSKNSLATVALLVLVSCGGGGGGGGTPKHKIGGTVSGLSGSGLVLQLAGGDELSVAAGATTFQFATAIEEGKAYAVTVKTQPAGQACTVADGTGSVGAADVTTVAVSCADLPTYTIGGAITGLGSGSGLSLENSAGGEILSIAAGASSYTFATPVPSGTAYTVTVASQPAGAHCTVSNPAGTIGAANVTDVDVTCSQVVVQSWKAPSTWGALWAPSPTLVQHAYFDGAQLVEDSASITWSLQGGAAPEQRAFHGFPAAVRHGAGPFSGQRFEAAGDAAVAALDRDIIVCAIFRPDYDGAAGQDKAIIARGAPHGAAGDDPAPVGEGWALTQSGGDFSFHYSYITTSDHRSVHVRAAVPTFFASELTGTDGVPDSVAVKPNSGPLNPSYVVFCGGRDAHALKVYAAVNGVGLDYTRAAGHYPNDAPGIGNSPDNPPALDAGTHALTIGGFATGGVPFGGRIFETAIWNEPGSPANIQKKLAAIQGLAQDGTRYARNREAPFYDAGGIANTATGYHTAWHDGPRIDPVKGFLFGMQAWNRVGDYARINRTTPLSGFPYVLAVGEDPGVIPILGVVQDGSAPPGAPTGNPTPGWTPSGGATVAATGGVVPPGDGDRATSNLVTLPVGGALTTPTRGFDAWGPVHGQIWLQVPSAATGKLRITLGYAVAGKSTAFDVDLSTLTPGEWRRVWLDDGTGAGTAGSGLWTSGVVNSVALAAHPGNAAPVSFYAWGLALTQVSTAPALTSADPAYGGSAVGDLGAEMYDWSVRKDVFNDDPTVVVDALQLPPVATSTAAGGFCLSADLTPGANLAWTAPFTSARTALAWVDDPASPTKSVKLYVSGATATPAAPPMLCMSVTGVAQPLCAAVPSTFTAGSKHTVTGCMSAAGQMRLHADLSTTPLASQAGEGTPDLQGGTLLVGGASLLTSAPGEPWNGYVSKAVACFDGVSVADCK